uniref:Uncharacterized protein n=1 Tax=Plectus sambesii TaxID=2011161 RepID=A0A914UI62_9BILA
MTSCKIVIAVLLCSIHNILGELENGKLFDEPVCDNTNSTLACNDTLAFDSKYRTYDGKCTNLMHADWGSNNQPFIRLLSAEYEGDLNLGLISRNFAFGSESVDTEQFDKDEEFHLDTHRTAMLGHFGQFIANDITHAFQETFNCNNADSLTCRSDTDRSRADFLPVNGRFLFTRTRSCESNGKREQVNIASAFIDASTVYGCVRM